MIKKLKQLTALQYLLYAVGIILLYLLLAFLINNRILNRYQANMLIPVFYNIIVVTSLNLAAGYLGQLPIGHAGFMALGAYASALFTLAVELPPNLEMLIGLIIGGCVAGFFGIIIGLPALRLRGDYLAIITLGFGEIIRVVLLNLEFTGGAFGLSGIARLTNWTWAYSTMVVSILIISFIINSRHGRAILSIRENEIAAESCGINTTYYKTITFAISAFFAGIGGVLYAHHLKILDPSTFGFMKSVEILVMVVLGGMGSLVGSIIAATGLTLLPEFLRSFADYRMVIYSLLLVIVMIFKPSGLMGTYDISLGGSVDHFFERIRNIIIRKERGEGENGGNGTTTDTGFKA